jgi:hypothetical protein
VGVAVDVASLTGVGVAVGSGVAVSVASLTGVGVSVGAGVAVGVASLTGVGVAVGSGVAAGVASLTGVRVAVGSGVEVGTGVAVGDGAVQAVIAASISRVAMVILSDVFREERLCMVCFSFPRRNNSRFFGIGMSSKAEPSTC